MTTITREQLIAKLKHRISVAASYPDVEEAQLDGEIFKIALASLEAGPVGYYRKGSDGYYFSSPMEQRPGTIPLYATPPAPAEAVTVPEEQTWEELCIDNPELTMGEAIIRAASWNACRAAMLSAAPQSPRK